MCAALAGRSVLVSVADWQHGAGDRRGNQEDFAALGRERHFAAHSRSGFIHYPHLGRVVHVLRQLFELGSASAAPSVTEDEDVLRANLCEHPFDHVLGTLIP